MKQFLLSIRSIFRFKTYMEINLIGLVLSLTCVFILVRYIHQEYTVNHFIPELERTFMMTVVNQKGEVKLGHSKDPNNDANYINPLNDPAVELVSRFIALSQDYITVKDYRHTVDILVADSTFFRLVPYPCLEGTIRMAPGDALISRQAARRIFGKENPIGKEMTTSTGHFVRIVGVLGEPSTKSSFQFDIVLSSELTHWMWSNFEIVRLHQTDDAKRMNQKNDKPMKLALYSDMPIRYQLTPLKDFYLGKNINCYSKSMLRGNASLLQLLALVAGLILLVGLFNYTNLYLMMMKKRSKELGIKKIFGANKRQLFLQLYGENFCLNGIALFFVWLLVEITRNLVANVYDIPVQSDIRFDIALSAGVWFILPLLTTLYPFWKYACNTPVHSFRTIYAEHPSLTPRFLFLFMQYAITFCMVITAIYLGRQLYFLFHTEVGYQTENIVQCRFLERTPSDRYDEKRKEQEEKEKAALVLIKKRINESPLFTGMAYGNPIYNLNMSTVFSTESGESTEALFEYTDSTYMNLFGFKVTEGRTWNETDEFTQYKMIVNRAFLNALHIKDWRTIRVTPDQRLWWSVGETNEVVPYEITGVMEDFKTGHLAGMNKPIVFVYSQGNPYDNIFISITPGKKTEAVNFLKDLYKEAIGKGDFAYSFVTDEIKKLHQEDQKIMQVIITFAVIAVGISCLGLFGLSLYDIRQRYREVALRKIHGAQVKDIYRLLLKKYISILTLAYLTGSCIAFVGIRHYMETFPHRAPLSLWIFLTAGILVLLIALLTLYWQVKHASLINPAEAIKRE